MTLRPPAGADPDGMKIAPETGIDFALQPGGAVEKAERVAIAGAAAFERPHPDERAGLPVDLAGAHIVQRLGRVAAEAGEKSDDGCPCHSRQKPDGPAGEPASDVLCEQFHC